MGGGETNRPAIQTAPVPGRWCPPASSMQYSCKHTATEGIGRERSVYCRFAVGYVRRLSAITVVAEVHVSPSFGPRGAGTVQLYASTGKTLDGHIVVARLLSTSSERSRPCRRADGGAGFPMKNAPGSRTKTDNERQAVRSSPPTRRTRRWAAASRASPGRTLCGCRRGRRHYFDLEPPGRSRAISLIRLVHRDRARSS